MNLDLRKYGINFTKANIQTELADIGAQPSDIQYITIEPGSSIPDYAFATESSDADSGFVNLELVYNLNACVSIGERAFSGCRRLENTDISRASTIGYNAFSGCAGLTNIRIKPGVSIPEECFYMCENLHTVYNLYKCTSIGGSAFDGCSRLENTDISSCSNIGECAFQNCTSLTTMKLKPGIVLKHGTFNGCTSLTTVYNLNKCVALNTENYEPGVFEGCESLRNSDISSCDYIGWATFLGCTSLTSMKLEEGADIKGSAFNGCSNLGIVYNLYKCINIEDYAFFGCSALTNNDVSKCNYIGDSAFQGCTSITQIKVKPGVQVGNNSFMGCGNIGVIYDLYIVGSIGDNALSGLYFPRNNTIKALDLGLTSKSLSSCLNESWNLPNIYKSEAIAKNWYGANQGVQLKCKDGTTVSNNQDSLTTINGTNKVLLKGVVDKSALEAAGYDSRSINTIEFGTGVTSIEDYALEWGSSLTSVTIPNSVTSIGASAFAYCNNLPSVTIPSSVMSIGHYAFDRCLGLTNIEFIDRTLDQVKAIPDADGELRYPWGLAEYIITGFVEDTVLYTTIESPSTWLESTPVFNASTGTFNGFAEKDIAVKVIIPSKVDNVNVTSIGESAFQGCTGLTSVTIGKGVTNIGFHAFEDCIGLTSVRIPDSVTSIGESAFQGCTGLTSVTIGNGVENILAFAFSGCSGLTSVTIPNSVQNIWEEAFRNCTGLTSITIGDGVTNIEMDAFNGCSELTSVTIPDSVTIIGPDAFSGCSKLTSMTFLDKTLTDVQDMEYYSWGVDPSIIQAESDM